jgi:methylmalonyl-CoA mutase N-terminal domain/subunit
VLGGTQSLHTNSMDEALALPTEKAARIALRTQQVIGLETGVAHVADPLGGSWYVEALTDEMERRAEEVFAQLDDLGGGSILEGVHAGIDNGYFQSRIAEASYDLEKRINAGDRIVVGVNRFTDGNEDDDLAILLISAAQEKSQLDRLVAVKQRRDTDAVAAALDIVRTVAADPEANLMPALLDATRTYATLGELMRAMGDVFGYYTETPVL